VLELQPLAAPTAGGHTGDVLALTYTPDNAYLLSAGWDGQLLLWDAESGTQAGGFRVSNKPASACAVAPDGLHAATGDMDGFLTYWDLLGQRALHLFAAHARPIAGLTFAGESNLLATASWDCHVGLWELDGYVRSRTLSGHTDLVAGCRFMPDGKALLSWSHDTSLRLWDVQRERLLGKLAGHADRVTAGGVSPDGRWAASGARDGSVKLWELATRQEAGAVSLAAEVRACLFLQDGAFLVVVDAKGNLRMYGVPDLTGRGKFTVDQPVQCAELSPSGGQIAVGCENGRVQFIAVAGFDAAPLLAPATRETRSTATRLQRLLGRASIAYVYSCTCPVCRRTFELQEAAAAQPATCPGCRRQLRFRMQPA
jgi:WD40 repeat protein